MKDAIEVFATLGQRLVGFGDDERTARLINEACRANGWFTPHDIRRSVATLTRDMLQRPLLEAWIAPYPIPVATPRRVLVVMAGNIPLVGFFDLLCVAIAGHRCLVKPSSKDRLLVEYMVGALREIEPAFPVEIYDGTSPVDAVIATGSDDACRLFRSRYGGLPTLLRGSRQSVAVLSGRETQRQIDALAGDIWTYSGLGCRSVSLLFVPEGALPELHMPEDMNPKYRNDYLRSRALLTMTGRPFVDLGGAVAVEQRAFPASLGCVAYSCYRDLGEVVAWLAGHDAEVQCVVTECLPHPRRAAFGCAQSPALADWPDQRDVLAFLATL